MSRSPSRSPTPTPTFHHCERCGHKSRTWAQFRQHSQEFHDYDGDWHEDCKPWDPCKICIDLEKKREEIKTNTPKPEWSWRTEKTEVQPDDAQRQPPPDTHFLSLKRKREHVTTEKEHPIALSSPLDTRSTRYSRKMTAHDKVAANMDVKIAQAIRKSNQKRALLPLITSGILKPGPDKLYCLYGPSADKKSKYYADLHSDGSIIFKWRVCHAHQEKTKSDRNAFELCASPSRLAMIVASHHYGKFRSENGWTKVYYEGNRLQHYKDLISKRQRQAERRALANPNPTLEEIRTLMAPHARPKGFYEGVRKLAERPKESSES